MTARYLVCYWGGDDCGFPDGWIPFASTRGAMALRQVLRALEAWGFERENSIFVERLEV